MQPRKLENHLVKLHAKEKDENYLKGLDEEDGIITWIWDSLKSELSDRFIDFMSVKDIWDMVNRLNC